MAFESATAQTQSIERSDRSADVRANTAMTGFIDYHALLSLCVVMRICQLNRPARISSRLHFITSMCLT